jgi:hypothetical protein
MAKKEADANQPWEETPPPPIQGPNPKGYAPEPLPEPEPEPGPEPEREDDQVEHKDTWETLPVKLTDLEYKEFGIKMGQANQDISKAEDELAAVKSQYKSRIDAAVAERNRISSIINSGVEYRKVDCRITKDFRAGTITIIRMDSHEVVRTRTMGIEERQRALLKDAPCETPKEAPAGP